MKTHYNLENFDDFQFIDIYEKDFQMLILIDENPTCKIIFNSELYYCVGSVEAKFVSKLKEVFMRPSHPVDWNTQYRGLRFKDYLGFFNSDYFIDIYHNGEYSFISLRKKGSEFLTLDFTGRIPESLLFDIFSMWNDIYNISRFWGSNQIHQISAAVWLPYFFGDKYAIDKLEN